MEAELHFLPLQGKGWCSGPRQLFRTETDIDIERIADSIIRQLVTIDES